jgi:hypothetical protein
MGGPARFHLSAVAFRRNWGAPCDDVRRYISWMTTGYDITGRGPVRSRPSYSIPSILSAVCAIGSFMSGAGFGIVLAIGAMLFGVIGVLLALAPGVRGGLVSVISILLGVIGIIAAVFKLIF